MQPYRPARWRLRWVRVVDAGWFPSSFVGVQIHNGSIGLHVAEDGGHLIHDELASRDTFRAAVVEFIDRVSAGETA